MTKRHVFNLLGIDFFVYFPRFLIEKGIDVSIKDDDGNTALHIALKEAIKTHSSSEVNEGIHSSELSNVIFPLLICTSMCYKTNFVFVFFPQIMITGEQPMVSIDDNDIKLNFQNLSRRKL